MNNNIHLLLHNIRSVYNTASIFRTSECLGVKKIWLSGYTPAPVDRFGRARSDFKKVSLGTENEIEWEEINNVLEFLKTMKQSSYELVGLEQTDQSVTLEQYSSKSENILLIPGTETTGVDQAILELCDSVIEIDQRGKKESLNVQSAVSIAIWKLLS